MERRFPGVGRHGPVRNGLTLVRLAAYSPNLNPVEECWNQLQNALGYRLFESLTELHTAIDTALEQLSIPDMSNYF